MPTLTDYSYC